VVIALPACFSLQLNKNVRKVFLKSAAVISSLGIMVNTASAEMTVAPFDDRIQYEVVEKGTGDQVYKMSFIYTYV
jgi:hypothetical protein